MFPRRFTQEADKLDEEPKNITIDRPTEKDAAEILALMKVIGGESDNLTFDGRGFYNTTLEEEEQLLKKKSLSDREAFFVVRKDSRIVGMGHFTALEKERMAHRGIIGICLRKSACGQGLGTALIEKLLQFGRDSAKTEIVSLEVRCDNIAASKIASPETK